MTICHSPADAAHFDYRLPIAARLPAHAFDKLQPDYLLAAIGASNDAADGGAAHDI